MSEPNVVASTPRLRVEPLASYHNRAAFSCGAGDQDNFLHKYAPQREERHISRTFLLIDPAAPAVVLGYYTLSNYTLALTSLPGPLRKGLPKYQPLPAILLGQLAVDSHHQHRGFGKLLLQHALRQALRVAQVSAAYGVAVHAATPDLLPFYHRYGFISLPDHPEHILAPMTLVARLFPEEASTPPALPDPT
jgi:GNAT superfamily N-acetyltransferase